jgi:hypothetical protein
MFRFAIRDVLWLTVVVALAVAWQQDHDRLGGEATKLKAHIDQLEDDVAMLRWTKVRTGPTFPYKPWGGIKPASSPAPVSSQPGS